MLIVIQGLKRTKWQKLRTQRSLQSIKNTRDDPNYRENNDLIVIHGSPGGGKVILDFCTYLPYWFSPEVVTSPNIRKIMNGAAVAITYNSGTPFDNHVDSVSVAGLALRIIHRYSHSIVL